METAEINFLLIWGLAYVFFALFVLYRSWRRIPDYLGGFPLNELTVLVPFRDEEAQLEAFLDSIINQSQLPKTFLFIDDHSSDRGTELIEEKLGATAISYRIIRQADGEFGKKKATECGVKAAQTRYCLCLDANTFFETHYFESLPDPKEAVLITLPVQLKGDSLLTKLFELEYASFQISQAVSQASNPILASGANLIFDRNTYLQYNENPLVTNAGDDHGILVYCKQKGLKIRSYVAPLLNVFSKAPANLNAWSRQRMRWLGNNRLGSDAYTKLYTFSAVLLQLGFLAICIYLIKKNYLADLLALLFTKLLLDFIVHLSWFISQKTGQLAPYMLLLSPLYPIMLLLLILRFIFFRKKLTWKGRRI